MRIWQRKWGFDGEAAEVCGGAWQRAWGRAVSRSWGSYPGLSPLLPLVHSPVSTWLPLGLYALLLMAATTSFPGSRALLLRSYTCWWTSSTSSSKFSGKSVWGSQFLRMSTLETSTKWHLGTQLCFWQFSEKGVVGWADTAGCLLNGPMCRPWGNINILCMYCMLISFLKK